MDTSIINTLIIAGGAVITIISILFYNSKCKILKCSKCCEIYRDTQHEVSIQIPNFNLPVRTIQPEEMEEKRTEIII